MSTVPSGTRFIGISERVNLKERKSAVLNSDTQPFTMQDIADTVSVGAQGPQGVQGPAGLQGEQGVPGTAGAVGPAGLNWQGAWVSETSYMEDDAVAYDGASWFCILATSGTTAPDLDTTHWALLASQGAQGVQGIQGITGATGPQGPTGPTGPQGVPGPNEIIDGIYKTTLTADGVLIQRTAQFGDYGSSIQINSTDIYLASAVTGTYGTITLPSAGISADHIYTLPNGTGTLALLPTVAGNYANDVAAAAAGIVVGSLYHTAGVVKVRLT